MAHGRAQKRAFVKTVLHIRVFKQKLYKMGKIKHRTNSKRDKTEVTVRLERDGSGHKKSVEESDWDFF
jgi:hypothetical protein